jgi:streptogramin lyase
MVGTRSDWRCARPTVRRFVPPVAAAAWLLMCATGASAAPLGTITEFSAGLNPGSAPRSIVAGADGNLWFTDDGSTRAIGRITPSGAINEFTAGLNPGSLPTSIVAGPGGSLWFADDGSTEAIGRITPSGAINEFNTGLQSGGHVLSPVQGPDGNLWFIDSAGHEAIGRITPSGAINEFTEGLPAFFSSEDIAAGPDGNLWFSDIFGAIGRITPGGTITVFSEGLNAGSDTTSIVTGPDGNLWFSDNGTSKAVGRITTSGNIKEFSVGCEGHFDCGVDGPIAGSDGNLWFAEPEKRVIARITPGGAIARFSVGALSHPQDPVLGPDGNIWFSDLFGSEPLHPTEPRQNAIGRVTPNGTIAAFASGLQPVAYGGASPLPRELTPGPDGNVWFIDGNAIARISTAESGSPTSPVAPTGESPPLQCTPGRAATAKRVLTLKITCTGPRDASSRLSASLTTRQRRHAGRVIALTASGRARNRVVNVTVGAGSMSVTGGQSVTLEIPLNGIGKRLLARFHRLPATLTIVVAGSSSHQTVSFKQPKRRRRHHHR